MSRKTYTQFKIDVEKNKKGVETPKIKDNSGHYKSLRIYDTASGKTKIRVRTLAGDDLIVPLNLHKKKRTTESKYNRFISKAIKKHNMSFTQAVAAWNDYKKGKKSKVDID